MLNVVPVTNSARKTPEVESSAEGDDRGGRGEGAELKQQHREYQHHGQRQNLQQILERLLLFRVGSAVHDADGGRNVQFGHGLLHCFYSLSQAYAFKTPRHRDVALQILAANFGLAGFVLKFRQRTERRGFAGRTAGEHGVADLIERRARTLRKAHPDGIGTVVDHHRSSRGLALQDRAGIQFNFLRRETRSGPRPPDPHSLRSRSR